MYAKIENNQVVEWPIMNLRQRLPEMSLPEVLTEGNLPDTFVIVHNVVPNYNPSTEKLVQYEKPIFQNNRWEYGYTVVDLDPQELETQTAALADLVRQQRIQLLAESDWTQVADAPVDKAAWATYRQQLREVTNQPGFPTNLEWPTKP